MASKVLGKAITEGQKSTAGKSGSIMAFEDTIMTKDMNDLEASTLLSILGAYIEYLKEPGHIADSQGSLLPRFLGAYVHQSRHRLFLNQTRMFVIMANVFAGVPPD